MRNIIILLSVLMQTVSVGLLPEPLKSQEIVPGSISFAGEWTDKNGKNRLTVQGRELCNPDHEYGAQDGHPSKVEVTLVNDRHRLLLTDSLTFDQCRMQTMLVRESEIWTTPFRNATIVFIPVFYCCNHDPDTRISYFVLYDSRKWLFDVQYLYEIAGDGFIKLNDNLERKLDFIRPKKLKSTIIKQITRKYTTAGEYRSVFDRWQAVYRDGMPVGCLYYYDGSDINAEGAYVPAELQVMSRKIEVRIPVSLSKSNDGTAVFVPDWIVHIREEREDRVILEFDSYSSGDSYYLEIRENNSVLHVTKAVMLWPSTTWQVNGGIEEEPDMIPLSAGRLLYKKVDTSLKGVLVFDDYFDDTAGFESYYLPRRYADDLGKCLEMMERKHLFRISDFEDGEESLKRFGIEDRELKQE